CLRADDVMQVSRTSDLPKSCRPAPRSYRLELIARPWRARQTHTKAKRLRTVFSSPRQLAACLLIFAGSALCTYVAATYAWMYVEQRILLHRWKAETASAGAHTL